MGKAVDAAPNNALSEEHVYDSSDEDESESSSPQETRKSKSKASQSKPVNGVKTALKMASRNLPSSTGSSSAAASDNDTDEDEDRGEKSSDGEDEDEDEEDDDSDKESASTPSSSPSRKRLSSGIPETPSSKRPKTTTQDKVSIPPKPFQRPKGYEPLTWSASDHVSDMDLFDDLSNKQIWHISVPSFVSIDSIKELDIEAVLRGQPILSRNGVDYGMSPLPSKDEIILLPHGTRGKYKQCARKIERSFHMREVSVAKSRSQSQADTPVVFTATQHGAPKHIRKQPEGLKMRYVPYGVSPSPGDKAGDVEMGDTSRIPPDQTSSSATQSRKARQKQTNGDPGNEKSPEKTLRGADTPASSEKKKKKKRRLIDEEVL
ncbi:hypothetical protein AYL99_01458 [Fonsecaea erecta]|uniref:Uncharacterized protein n=1 Tax=Fonsecaea erecta TaxID=1367422 RepID=A0A179A1Q9_9EURO|nr:hypothetical protein AYL99_01458 [Fonsecaea erecta]OAP65486.1 hypothetical protein AYL99_01458 [Fonsecaea erecta]